MDVSLEKRQVLVDEVAELTCSAPGSRRLVARAFSDAVLKPVLLSHTFFLSTSRELSLAKSFFE